MGWPQCIVLAVALQRLAELILARRNSRLLLAEGGREAGRRHYPLFVILHGAWLLALFLEVPAGTAPNALLLTFFVGLQAMRVWIIASLGRFWTTRVITVDDAPLVRRGPYRWMQHPNYLVVALEIALLPLAFGAWEVAVVFSILNLPLTIWRIRVEAQSLAARRHPGERPP